MLPSKALTIIQLNWRWQLPSVPLVLLGTLNKTEKKKKSHASSWLPRGEKWLQQNEDMKEYGYNLVDPKVFLLSQEINIDGKVLQS